uniref:Ig-like domain-containing protein n=1 Tax=Neogobius melanostomus TaxID=47308 RepID=A0A8C6TZW0_9GOBI
MMDPGLWLRFHFGDLCHFVTVGVNCQVWKATMPQRIMGVEGSCVSVPCSFIIPDEYVPYLSNCSGGAVWKRGSMHSPKTRTVSGHLAGDLRHKNCTTVFQNFTKAENDIYFFRLDCKNRLTYSFMEEVRINVEPGISDVEGSQLTLECVAMAPCPYLPPSIKWAAPQGRRQDQIISDGQMTLKSTLTFTASAHHHNHTVTCSVSYPLSAGGSTEAFATSHPLNVLYGPKSTSAELSVSGPVSEGRVVIFNCSSKGNPPVTAYTWFCNTNGTMVKLAEGRTLPLQVKRAHSGLYQCQAQSERGAQRSESLVLEVHSVDTIVLWISAVCGVLSVLCVFTVALLLYCHLGVTCDNEGFARTEFINNQKIMKKNE